MSKEILSKTTDEGLIQLEIRIPGFQNFGERMAEIEKAHSEAMFASPSGPEPASWLAAIESGQGLGYRIQKKVADAIAASLEIIIKMIIMVFAAGEREVDEDPDDQDEEREDGEAESSDRFTVFVDEEDVPWSPATERRLDQFIDDWPRLRPDVKRAAFDYYAEEQEHLLEDLGMFECDRLLMPDPSGPDVVEDLFCFDTIYLLDDEIGLAGPCTWDEEHGFGIRIRDGDVVCCGQHSIAFESSTSPV